MMYSLRIPAINLLLNQLASHITEDKLQVMKFLIDDKIPAADQEQCRNARDVFTKLKQRCLIGEHNLELLENLFNAMDLNHLALKVQEFKDRIASEGQVNDIPQQQTETLPAPRQILVTLLIDQDVAEFNQAVMSNIQQSICQALGIDIAQVTYLFRRPYNSYYIGFQLPETSAEDLKEAAKSQVYWLSNLRCLEVQINDLSPIRLQHTQESFIEPDSMQVDNSDPYCDDLETDGSFQNGPFCRYQEPNKVQVTFTFHGSLLETEVTLEYVEVIRLNLCANLNCTKSTDIYYLEFNRSRELNLDLYHMTFLVPQYYFQTLDFCCKNLKEWLKEMNIFEIHTRHVSSGTKTPIYRCCS